ncbi:P-loop containing nucleoside triphosphate hydrolase superfamily protein [Abeliophyllum distichum]|uniref:P-loop containing nucleoside triphosphate hydrolase superfamily protein n=1 Tax=Abeliophyllum distichum TaxID=126358 RepID=A0ABD1T0D2_9LAMI
MEKIREAANTLDIRVRRILKAWRHEEADSLYVGEVDVGEPEPIIICSGLVNYTPPPPSTEMQTGGRVKSVGSTNANELSSRSHCLLRVTNVAENLVIGQRMNSHLWLVDLAGSERVGRIEVKGERLKESQFINKSLSALGDVISVLASKASHIPLRNSKLSHILQSSLGKLL